MLITCNDRERARCSPTTYSPHALNAYIYTRLYRREVKCTKPLVPNRRNIYSIFDALRNEAVKNYTSHISKPHTHKTHLNRPQVNEPTQKKNNHLKRFPDKYIWLAAWIFSIPLPHCTHTSEANKPLYYIFVHIPKCGEIFNAHHSYTKHLH